MPFLQKAGPQFWPRRGAWNGSETVSDEGTLKLLREIQLKLVECDDVQTARRAVGVSDATYYRRRRRFGGVARSQLLELRNLEKENARMRCLKERNNSSSLEPVAGTMQSTMKFGQLHLSSIQLAR